VKQLLFIFLASFFLLSCDKKEKKSNVEDFYNFEEEQNVALINDEGLGTLIANLGINNIPFNNFYFKIRQIIIINSVTDESYALTAPGNLIGVDHSSLQEQSYFLAINQHIPAGIYDRVLLMFSMENAVIRPSNQGDADLPLVDAVLNSIPEERSEFTVEAYIAGDEKLKVESGKIQQMTIELDVEASTRYVPLPHSKLGIMFTPQIKVSHEPSNNKVLMEGITSEVTEQHLSLIHAHKVQPKKPENKINYAIKTNSADIYIDGVKQSSIRYGKKDYWSFFDADMNLEERGFSLDLSTFYALEKASSFKIFSGVIVSSSGEKVTLTGFYQDEGHYGLPMQRKLINKSFSIVPTASRYFKGIDESAKLAIKLETGQRIWAVIDTRSFEIKHFLIRPSRLLAVVNKATDDENILHPLSYNNVDQFSSNYPNYFPHDLGFDNSLLKLTEGQMVNIQGYQLAGDSPKFHSLFTEVVSPDASTLFSISMPGIHPIANMEINDKTLTMGIASEVFDNRAFIKTRYPKTNAQVRHSEIISEIIVNEDDSVSMNVVIDGTDPVQSFSFDKVSEFHDFMKEKTNSDKYFLNELIVEGMRDGDTYNAKKLSIILLNRSSLKEGNNDYDDDDDEDYVINQSVDLNSKTKNFLLIAMPILVPVGVTLAITAVIATVSGILRGTVSTVQHSFQRTEMEKKLRGDKISRTEEFISEINKKYQGLNITNLADLQGIVDDNTRLSAIRFQLKENTEQLKLFQVSPNSNIDSLIKFHNALDSYLASLESETEKVLNVDQANNNYEKFLKLSDELQLELLNFVNQSVFNRGTGKLATAVETYTNDLSRLVLARDGSGIVNEETLKKTADQNARKRLEKYGDQIRNMKIRF
jgi:hypothetical protein